MREYTWECDHCDKDFVVVCDPEKYNEKPECPVCESKEFVYRNFAADRVSPHYVNGLHECKTLGQYADKQSEKMSTEQKAEILAKQVTKKDPNSGMKELPAGMTRGDYTNAPSPLTAAEAKLKRKGRNG